MTPFEKNFYVETPSIAAMTDEEVAQYRRVRDITIEGRDVPKPVKTFSDVGFPGILLLGLLLTCILYCIVLYFIVKIVSMT